MTRFYCSIKDCGLARTKKHRFPNPSREFSRFEKWVHLSGNQALLNKTPEKIYNSSRVCSDHFELDNFGPNDVLLKSALPSLNLPKALQNVSFEINTDKTDESKDNVIMHQSGIKRKHSTETYVNSTSEPSGSHTVVKGGIEVLLEPAPGGYQTVIKREIEASLNPDSSQYQSVIKREIDAPLDTEPSGYQTLVKREIEAPLDPQPS